MLELINIKLDELFIEADYIPENSNEMGHVSVNRATGKGNADIIEKYGSMYGRMAINGLKRALEEYKNGKISDIPKRRLVMWY